MTANRDRPTLRSHVDHCSTSSQGVVLSLTFQGGAFYGHVGPDGDDFPSDQQGAKLVARLCARGFARQLLLSHGVCCRLQLRRYGCGVVCVCVCVCDWSAFIGRATAWVSGEGEAGLLMWAYLCFVCVGVCVSPPGATAMATSCEMFFRGCAAWV